MVIKANICPFKIHSCIHWVVLQQDEQLKEKKAILMA